MSENEMSSEIDFSAIDFSEVLALRPAPCQPAFRLNTSFA